METAAERKRSLRAEVWQRRRAMSPDEREAAGAGIAFHGFAWATSAVPEGGTLTAYLGLGAEPPTLPLLGRLHARGFHLLLPICEPERQLSWVEWQPNISYERSRFAPLQEPVGPRLDARALQAGDADRPPLAAILLPATALDADGRRVGQGGGYYDRFLAQLSGGAIPATAAIVFDAEVLPPGGVPDEPLDRRVQAAITPSGIRHLGNIA
ncbi:5-formyltetrahydrofolate cyclo-ligase [Sinomonas humi]|uniref:5-formyltetrahydrofolate cyclo-ligase n=1 Tax=Sinomonas humi TaxID=1338436 RepID=UPI00069051BE|nr:5-formyltetrahydrofolate cyclo-ligase [Sinomonas humi]